MSKENLTTQLKERVKSGSLNAKLEQLYGGDIKRQQRRYITAIEGFEKLYGVREAAIYSVPGRTELCGNHTDHQRGIVMAGAVNLDIIAVVSQNDENIVRVKSKGFPYADEVKLDNLGVVEREKGSSKAIIRGVAAGIAERGGEVAGFDAFTFSDVLGGSGLSSSAAFEVCIGSIFSGEFNDGRFTATELAQIGQFAENNYLGKPSGLMDQLTCAVGGLLRMDFASDVPSFEKHALDLRANGMNLVVVDTKGSHADLTEEYSAIKNEMCSVAEFFGKTVLAEVDKTAFFDKIGEIRKATGDRAILRAIHFYEECEKVDEFVELIDGGKMSEAFALLTKSGQSSFMYNQNAYCIKYPERQAIPVALAVSERLLGGRGAWRLQGGGFAGTIQAFVPDDMLGEYCATLEQIFGKKTCYVLSFRQDGALKVI